MCTRIFWNDNGIANVTSRCMDWGVSDEPELWFLPRGLKRSAVEDPNALSWESKYSSVSTSMWGVGAADGINEHGLAAHLLYLNDVVWPSVDARPGLTHALWAQYVLDNYTTVAAVLADLESYRLFSPDIRGLQIGVHLAIEDASGDSAIIEPHNGELIVHHGREYRVMANSPLLDDQLQNLARYAPFGGELPPPGDIKSMDRFVRANYFLNYLPKPETTDQALAGVFQLIQNVAVPFGAPDPEWGVYPTWWYSVCELDEPTYYFQSRLSATPVWIRLSDVANGTQVLKIDPTNTHLFGDVAGLLEPAELTF
jgi:penicillin V acylase-like amidase (Ntn superfamily)